MNPYKQKMIKNLESIKEYMQSFNKDCYTPQELSDIYKNCILLNYIYKDTPATTFKKFLKDNNLWQQKIQMKFFNKKFIRYFTYEPNIYEVALSIDTNVYFSHYTSVYIYNLTNNIPKIVFVNKEHSKPTQKKEAAPLEQKNIDKAFYSSPRSTQNLTTYKTQTINILNGKYTANLGVIKKEFDNQAINITDTERTLIDITVSPHYCGGAYEVLNVYKKAKGIVNINKLASMLKELDYIYPYHQAIGFFLEKAGYKEADLKLFEEKGIKYRFFVQRELRHKDRKFSDRWNLYYPEFL